MSLLKDELKKEAAAERKAAKDQTPPAPPAQPAEPANAPDTFLDEMNAPQEPEGDYEAPDTKPDYVPPHEDANHLNRLLEEAEAKATKDAEELTAQYLDLNKFGAGEERTFVFTGMTTFIKPDTGEVIPAVKLQRRDESYICASTVIVQSLQKVEQLPIAIRIKVNGKVKGTKGSYFDVKVYFFKS